MTLHAIEGRKREPCPYCGSVEHPAAFACPRIRAVTVYADGIYEVELRDMPEPEPEDAA